MQLLALLIEVTSIGVAGKQIKKPIDIPRPGKKSKGESLAERSRDRDAGASAPPAPAAAPGADPYKQGVATLMQSARPRR